MNHVEFLTVEGVRLEYRRVAGQSEAGGAPC
jgi:hypothetical protein